MSNKNQRASKLSGARSQEPNNKLLPNIKSTWYVMYYIYIVN